MPSSVHAESLTVDISSVHTHSEPSSFECHTSPFLAGAISLISIVVSLTPCQLSRPTILSLIALLTANVDGIVPLLGFPNEVAIGSSFADTLPLTRLAFFFNVS